MYLNADPTHVLQLINQKNAEDLDRLAHRRLARNALLATRGGRRTVVADDRPITAPTLPPRVLGWRWLGGAMRSLRCMG